MKKISDRTTPIQAAMALIIVQLKSHCFPTIDELLDSWALPSEHITTTINVVAPAILKDFMAIIE
jgi:hypothetical protein